MQRAAPIALIGLGLVGEALAGRLARSGFAISGWDIEPARRAVLAGRGVHIADSAVEACRDATCVLLALPDTTALAIVLDTVGPVLAPRTIVLSFGTDDPEAVAAHASALAMRDVALLDVPLSGSSAQIAAGEAVLMGGGAWWAWEASAPLLATIAAQALHMGAAGSGSRAKLATNLLLGLNRAALAESLVFAEALGLDLDAFLGLVRVSPAYSRAADVKGGKMLARDYTPESRIRQHRKDVGLMLDAARRQGHALPLSTTHAALLDAAITSGAGELDNAAIIETIRRWPLPAQPA